MKLSKIGVAGVFAMLASVTGGASLANAQPVCEHTVLTVQIPQPNPYDKVGVGSLPEPSGVGFEVTLRQVGQLSVTEFTPEMPLYQARAKGLGQPVSVVSDANARAVFNDLPEGVYIVSVKTPDDAKYRKAYIDDFLVSVPLGGKCVGEVDAKIHYTPNPTTPPPSTHDTPKKPENPLPQTGTQIAGMGLLGAVVTITGVVLLRSRRIQTRGGNE